MRTLLIFIIILILSSNSNCEIIKPNVSLEPNKVIEIQLTALQKNNNPYQNAGIEQTWEFAHPSNRIFTGPLKRFTNMMYSSSYKMMLNHQKHEILEVNNDMRQLIYESASQNDIQKLLIPNFHSTVTNQSDSVNLESLVTNYQSTHSEYVLSHSDYLQP